MRPSLRTQNSVESSAYKAPFKQSFWSGSGFLLLKQVQSYRVYTEVCDFSSSC